MNQNKIHVPALDNHEFEKQNAPALPRLAFSHDSTQLWAVSDENRLDRFELGAGRVVQQVGQGPLLQIYIQ